jgi:hypothetical protein
MYTSRMPKQSVISDKSPQKEKRYSLIPQQTVMLVRWETFKLLCITMCDAMFCATALAHLNSSAVSIHLILQLLQTSKVSFYCFQESALRWRSILQRIMIRSINLLSHTSFWDQDVPNSVNLKRDPGTGS